MTLISTRELILDSISVHALIYQLNSSTNLLGTYPKLDRYPSLLSMLLYLLINLALAFHT
jgi:hypothetical protein